MGELGSGINGNRNQRNSLSTMEHGKVEIGTEILLRISREFGKSIEWAAASLKARHQQRSLRGFFAASGRIRDAVQFGDLRISAVGLREKQNVEEGSLCRAAVQSLACGVDRGIG